MDPLADLRLSVAGYARLVLALKALADELCAGRLAFTLEGGYDRDALSQGVAATFCELLGRPYTTLSDATTDRRVRTEKDCARSRGCTDWT